MSVLNQQTQNFSLNNAVAFAKPKDICVVHQENDTLEIVRVYHQSEYQQWEGCFTFLG